MATTPPTQPTSGDTTIHISFKLVGIVVGVLLIAVAGVRFGLMHSVVVQPGEEAVFVDKPYIWGKQGIRSEPLVAGRKTEFNTTSEIIVNVSPTAYSIVLDDLPAKDGVAVDVELSVVLRVTNSPDLISKFGSKWYTNSVVGELTPLIRAAIGRRVSKDLINDPDTQHQIQLEIEEDIKQMLVENEIAVELTGASITHIQTSK